MSGPASPPRACPRWLRASTSHLKLRGALLLAVTLAGAGTLAPPACAKRLTAANWDRAAQQLVTRDGVMGELGTAGFAGAQTLSASAERAALNAIAARMAVAPLAFNLAPPLTVVRFDALLVDQLGLGDVAEHVQQVAAAAGIDPPGYFGSEVVARYLELRYEHTVGEQALDLYPWQPITRAEAAHSFAVVLGLLGAPRTPASQPEDGQSSAGSQGGETAERGDETAEGGEVEDGDPQESGSAQQGGEAQTTRAEAQTTPAEGQTTPTPESWALANVRETLMGFSLPSYSPAQREVLRIAVSKIGMPYVWGGTTDNTADGLEHGGYDCSGFAWRVYKVSGLPWGRQIRGRTAAEQAGEIPRSRRIHPKDVAPGDLLFFGSARFNATATNANVIHEAIALSGQWAINSSAQGVYVLPLTSGWLAESFVWARRVL